MFYSCVWILFQTLLGGVPLSGTGFFQGCAKRHENLQPFKPRSRWVLDLGGVLETDNKRDVILCAGGCRVVFCCCIGAGEHSLCLCVVFLMKIPIPINPYPKRIRDGDIFSRDTSLSAAFKMCWAYSERILDCSVSPGKCAR